MLSIITAFAISGCSNNDPAAEQNTVTTTTNTVVGSTDVLVESE
ncbi:hypothetical protein [uncultured Psychrobacter sp.]